MIHSHLFLAALIVAAPAQTDPLALIPDIADFVVVAPQPKKTADLITASTLVDRVYKLAIARELVDSTNMRRVKQLLTFVEKKLGTRWPNLLDDVAGNGIALSVKIGPEPAPAVLVILGKDEKHVREFYDLANEVVEQELARQEKAKPSVQKYRKIEMRQFGATAWVARVGAAIISSNSQKELEAVIDLHHDGDANSLARRGSLDEAKKLLPSKPIAWAWLDLDKIKQASGAKEVFAQPRNDPNLTVILGGILDVARRAPYVCAALAHEKDDLLFTIRMPRGRDGMGEECALHIPAVDSKGLLPILEPKGVLYSDSFHFDFSRIWEDRARLFNDKQVKGLEDADKNSAKYLLGIKLSQVLNQLGARHRFLAVHQEKSGYESKPQQRIPAFALVTEVRDAKGAKTMETILRAAALLAGNQFKLKMVNETVGDIKLVTYRFPEDVIAKNDPDNIRFNFSPCFATVGNKFLVCSTAELARTLIPMLEKEDAAIEGPTASRSQFYATGAADLLKASEDLLVAQTILNQALPPDEAKQQVKQFLDIVRSLDRTRIDTAYETKSFRFEVRQIRDKK